VAGKVGKSLFLKTEFGWALKDEQYLESWSRGEANKSTGLGNILHSRKGGQGGQRVYCQSKRVGVREPSFDRSWIRQGTESRQRSRHLIKYRIRS
jgi:hypothetical protein